MVQKEKLILTNIIVVVFCLLIELVVIYATISNANNIISVFIKEQEVLVNEVSRQAKVILTNSNIDKSKTENDVVLNIIKNEITSGVQYWLFATDNKVIFLRDESFTSKMGGQPFETLLNQYKDADGENINLIEDMFQLKKSGTVIFTKRSNARQEILSVNFFKVGEKTYAVGMITAKDYVLSNSKVIETSTYIYIISALSCIIIIVMKFYFSMIILKKSNDLKRVYDELQSRNKLIEGYNSEQTSEPISDEEDKIYDELTGTYSKQFFRAALDNLKNKGISPIYLIQVNIKMDGINIDSDIMKNIAEIIKKSVPENTIVARIDHFKFVVIFIKSNFENTQVYADIISDGIWEVTGKIDVVVRVESLDNLYIEQKESEHI